MKRRIGTKKTGKVRVARETAKRMNSKSGSNVPYKGTNKMSRAMSNNVRLFHRCQNAFLFVLSKSGSLSFGFRFSDCSIINTAYENEARCLARNFPVGVSAQASSSGDPSNMSFPPDSPPVGPISII